MTSNLLMIAARVPTPGETKTRLGATLGMATAAAVYEGFLRDLAGQLDGPGSGAHPWDLAWTFSPPDADYRAVLEQVIGRGSRAGHFVAQDGPDWGVRQLNLLRWGIDAGYERVILMASDSPQLVAADLARAFDALDDADIVLGRVRDGGYYLIGMRGFHDVLTNVAMSTASAADGLVARGQALGLRVAEVPVSFDVDEVSDLEFLRTWIAKHPQACQHTAAALDALDVANMRERP